MLEGRAVCGLPARALSRSPCHFVLKDDMASQYQHHSVDAQGQARAVPLPCGLRAVAHSARIGRGFGVGVGLRPDRGLGLSLGLCLILGAGLGGWPSWAQAQSQGQDSAPRVAETAGSDRVVVTGRNSLSAPVSGFDAPLRELPLGVARIGAQDMVLSGATRLADLIGFDSSVSDAYNAAGYVDYLTMRGFVIDNRYNIRRDGLPIHGETAIGLENKAAVELLKGTSGLQAGTSAPGGLVNYAVKRPQAAVGLQGQLRLQASARATLLAAVDVGGRTADAAQTGALAWRLNLAEESLKPTLFNADGQRRLAALALEWRPNRWALLEVEGEWSRRAQPTQQAFSLLGDRLPAVPDRRLNLNHQPWSQPAVFEGRTGSLRLSHELTQGWRAVLQAGRQRLRTDDRIAFAYGRFDPVTYECNPCDRFAADGSFSVWDYRSENERRSTDALQLELSGRAQLAGLRHDLRLGVMQSRQGTDLQPQAYNLVGTGSIQGKTILPADGTALDPNTNRDERAREWFVQDAVRLTSQWTAWLGLRHTQLDRRSVRTNGSRATAYEAGLTTPWLALSVNLPSGMMVYASRGEGAETQVVPNRPSQYTNAGAALPVLKSVQQELGVRGGDAVLNGRGWQWNATLFDISRPTSNLDACANLGLSPCTGQIDGQVVHRGLEAGTQWARGAWLLGLQGTWLDAQRQGSTVEPALNGLAPTNVPQRVLRGRARWTLPGFEGVAAQLAWSQEGPRQILPDNSLQLPGWRRLDAVISGPWAGGKVQWLVGVDNLADARYWREAPFQFGHAYLYPGAGRTVRASVLIGL